jgi:putative ATPase
MRTAKEAGSLLPPKRILNSPTRLMESEGYGSGYQYDHDAEGQFSGQTYFPDGMERQQFYQPKGAGREGPIREKLEQWAKLRSKRQSDDKE